jgi:hypothetical protein
MTDQANEMNSRPSQIDSIKFIQMEIRVSQENPINHQHHYWSTQLRMNHPADLR